MLEKLFEIERDMPALLWTHNGWSARKLIFDVPFRLERWTIEHKGLLVRLNVFPGDGQKEFMHYHLWAGAMRIVEGGYELGIGYSKTMETPPVSARIQLRAGDCYDMTDPDLWHSVKLTEETLTVCVSKFYDDPSRPPEQSVLETDSVPLARTREIFERYRRHYPARG